MGRRQSWARLAILAGLLLGCAASPSPTGVEDILAHDDGLPGAEKVEAAGTLAVKRWLELDVQGVDYLRLMDVPSATEILIKLFDNFPIAQIVSEEGSFEIVALALAHQWGRTQLALDTVLRYERVTLERQDDLQRRDASWALFLQALSSAGYPLNAVSATMAIRLKGASVADTNEETYRFHRLVVEAYEVRVDSLEDVRVTLGPMKDRLVNYSKVLEGRRDALLKAQATEGSRMVPQALEILASKASGM